MKEISFKMRKNYEQNRKFCVVKVETLLIVFTCRSLGVVANVSDISMEGDCGQN